MANTVSDYAVPFAAWEVRLYLDTHPADQAALAAYRQLCAQCWGEGNYACLSADAYNGDCWRWIDDPWPWEIGANCPVGTRSQNACRQCGNCGNSCPCARRG